MRKFILFAAVLFSFCLQAQQFRYEAVLPVVDSTGFYKILLAPQLNAKLMDGFADLRLFGSESKEIPYVLREDNPMTTSSVFREYEIAEKKFLKDSVTIIVLLNNKSENINNISLLIRNADAQKTMNLSGSFDRKQWFVLKESEMIYSVRDAKDVAEIKLINFPLTNYTFLKIEINDKRSAPLDIIKAGYYESVTVKGSYTELKSSLSISDSAKKKTTWAHVVFDEEMLVDEAELLISEPQLYMRSVNIWYSRSGYKQNYRNLLSSMVINSKSPKRYTLRGIKTKALWFEIINEDSPPLRLSGIKIFQINHYCLAELEKEKQYVFRFGDSILKSPRYDIRYFEMTFPDDAKRIISHGEVISLKLPAAGIEKQKSIFTDKRFIWAALILIISLLGFVSYRMVKETR